MLEYLTDLGLQVRIYKEENDPRTPEVGPYRAEVFMPYKGFGHLSLIGSGVTMDLALLDIDSIPYEELKMVGTSQEDRIRESKTNVD